MKDRRFSEMSRRELHDKALKRLQSRRPDISAMENEDLESLVHELEVYQAELEVQNEQLRQTEEKLTELSNRYSELYEFAPVGYLTMDEGGIIRQANLALANLCGRERQDIIGKRFEKLAVPEDRDKCYLHLQELAANEKEHSTELRFWRPDGDIVWGLVESIHVDKQSRADGDVYRTTFTDITERVQAQQQVTKQKEQLDIALKGGEIGIWDYNVRTDEITWSDKVYELLGHDKNETITVGTFFQYIHEQDRARIRQKFDKWFDIGGEFYEEFRIVRKDKKILWLVGAGRLFRDSEGRPWRAAGVNYDITERKRAEKDLHESEERFRIAAKSAELGAYSRNLKTGENHWSPEFLEIYGLKPDEPLELTDNIPAAVHPDDRQQVLDEARARLDRKTEPEFASEHRIIRPDGEIRWVMIRGRVEFDANDEPVSLHGIAMDITRHKQDEQKLQRDKEFSEALNRINDLLHSTLDFEDIIQRLVAEGVFTLGCCTGAVTLRDDDGWIISHVDGLDANLIGMRLNDDDLSHAIHAVKTGKAVDISDALHDERFAPEHFRKYNIQSVLVVPLISRGEALGVLFFNYHTRQHSFTPEEISFARQLATSASIALKNAELYDQSERAHKALQELNETLEQRVDERTGLIRRQANRLRALANQLSKAEQRERKRLARVLHDHVQQLIVVAQMHMGFVDDNVSGEIKEHARVVKDMLADMLETTRSLSVDLSPPVLQEAGLGSALEWLSSRMQEQSDFNVKVHADSDAEPASDEIRVLLFECARELLFNAMKHAGTDQADVTLTRQAEQIKLIVSDKGEGFEPDLLSKRLTLDASLGLFSIQQRMSQIGGHMEIDTAPDQGTRIVLNTPAGEIGFTEEELPAREQEKLNTIVVRHKSEMCRVLVVDDHDIVRQGVVELLDSRQDIEVIGQAESGQKAVNLAEKLKPDVVIMDVAMGEMSGVEATRRILANNPDIKVIALSMHIDKGMADAMYKAGATAYITKGGPADELVQAIRDSYHSQNG